MSLPSFGASPGLAAPAQAAPPAALVTGLALAGALAFGAVVSVEPVVALALVTVVPLALAAPVASLGLLLVLTVVVPFDLQNRVAFIGGEGVPGLLVVDLLLLVCLLRVAVLVATRRLDTQAPVLAAVGFGLVLVALLVGGVAEGAGVSDAGHEARRLAMGAGAFIVAWPLLEDAVSRERLKAVLVVLGLCLGAWGLAQWLFAIDFTAGADVGIRPGVEETSGGRGSLQGGLYGYPVAVTFAFAALLSGWMRSLEARFLVALVLLLNAVCLLLTYERTFWAAAVVGCLVVALRSGPAARRAAPAWMAAGAVVVLTALMLLGETRTATERLFSVTEYSSHDSFESRQVESRAVSAAISERPLTGSGLGATITWGKEGVFRTETTPFSHNGYLWLAWKVGLPLAALLVGVLLMAALRPAPRGEDGWLRTLRVSSQASLLALLVIGLTFPPFNAFGITAAMGVMVAACLVRPKATG